MRGRKKRREREKIEKEKEKPKVDLFLRYSVIKPISGLKDLSLLPFIYAI